MSYPLNETQQSHLEEIAAFLMTLEVYPPLCFTENPASAYSSKAEIFAMRRA